jgi:hypothetical protein
MKNTIFKSSLIALLAQFFILPATLAAEPATYFPAELPYYLELDTNQEHPFNNMLKDLLIDNLEIPEDEPVVKILLENIDQTKLAVGFMDGRINTQPIMLLTLSIDQEAFDKISKSENVDVSELGSGKNIYQVEEGFYFTYLGGNLISSNEFGLISDLLLTKNTSSLYNSASFQNFQDNLQNPGFLKVYLNLEKLLASETFESSEIPGLLNLPQLFKAEGISLQQNLNGFNAEVYLEMTPESDYPINDLLFVPEIYKKINADKLAFYQESFNINAQTSLWPAMFGTEFDFFGEIKTLLQDELNLNWETDLAPLLQNRTAISMHYSDQIIPEFSLITQIGNSTTAQNTNQKLIAKLTEILNEQVDTYYQTYLDDQAYLEEFNSAEFQATVSKEEFTQGLMTISESVLPNGKFTTFTLKENQYTTSTQSDFQFKISMGTTLDGFWVITLADPAKLFSPNGLLADSEFNKNYQNRSQRVTDISFVNFTNLNSFLKNVFNLVAMGSTEETMPEELSLFLEPLQSMYSETISVGNNGLKGNIKINLDINKLSNYQELFERLMASDFLSEFEDLDPLEEVSTAIEFNPEQCIYNDVSANDWFYFYIGDICFDKIMTGYDNQFKPNQAITRAEFIKTVMAAQDHLGYFYTSVEPEVYFSDIEASQWYAYSVNKARAHQIVEGFSDNTFRPNQPITRAEAIQIIYNLNDHSGQPANPNFQDVSTSDWFYQAVSYAKESGLVGGKNNLLFAPQENLTRAETAKIINNYINFNQ